MLRIILGALLGGGIGFALGFWGKCNSGAGTCPLTSNPYISTPIGIIIGIIIAMEIGK